MSKTVKVITIISVILAVVMIFLYERFNTNVFLSFAITFGTTSYHFVIRLLIGFLVNLAMDNHADYNKSWFQPRAFEEKLYQTIKVKKWKGKMPTYNSALFSLKKHSLDEIAQAMCQSEVVHEIIVVCSFVPLAVVPVFGQFFVFLFTSVAAACFDMMFVIMQRYNRARIVKIIGKS